MFEFLSSAAAGPALWLQILSENVSDPPTLIPLLLLILFRLLKINLHKCGALQKKTHTHKKENKSPLPQHQRRAALTRIRAANRVKKAGIVQRREGKRARRATGGAACAHSTKLLESSPTCSIGTGVRRGTGPSRRLWVLTRLGVFLLSFSRFTSGS